MKFSHLGREIRPKMDVTTVADVHASDRWIKPILFRIDTCVSETEP